MIKRVTLAAALAGGGGVAYVASDPNTELVLWNFDTDNIDDEACKACEFEAGAECWCPPPGQPVSETIVCGCYSPDTDI